MNRGADLETKEPRGNRSEMPADKIQLTFNKDKMPVSDLKQAANTLHAILRAYQRDPDNWEDVGGAVAQLADQYAT